MKCNECSYIRCFYKQSNAAQGSPEVRQYSFYMPQCNKCTVQSYSILYTAEPSQQPVVQGMCICAIIDGSSAANCYSLAFLLLKPCIEALGCCIKKNCKRHTVYTTFLKVTLLPVEIKQTASARK